MDIDTHQDLINAGLIDDDIDEPAFIEGHDDNPDLLNDMKEEAWRTRTEL